MRILENQKEYFEDQVGLSIFNVIGSPGSGKTTFVKTLIKKLVDIIGRDRIYYIYTRDIRDCFKEINTDYKYHIFYVDDAGKNQDSRRSMSSEGVELFENLPDVRHIAKNIHGLEEGRIIIFLASHVPKHIDQIIRSFEKMRFYKDMNLQEDQYKKILDNCDFNYRDKKEVERWVDKITEEDPEALSKVLAVKRSGRWGWVRFSPEDGIEPDLNNINYSIPDDNSSSSSSPSQDQDNSLEYDPEDLEDLLETELEKMKETNDYMVKAQVLDMIMNSSKSNIEIAQELDIKEGSISYYKSQAMGELKRRVGLEYEKLVASELEEMGYKEIDRRGGTGEPDIIALDPEGTLTAVSVKLYSYGRPRHSLDKEEFNPELNFKDNNEEAQAYIWYTNLEWGGKTGKTYFEEIPEALDRVVIHKRKGLVK